MIRVAEKILYNDPLAALKLARSADDELYIVFSQLCDLLHLPFDFEVERVRLDPSLRASFGAVDGQREGGASDEEYLLAVDALRAWAWKADPPPGNDADNHEILAEIVCALADRLEEVRMRQGSSRSTGLVDEDLAAISLYRQQASYPASVAAGRASAQFLQHRPHRLYLTDAQHNLVALLDPAHIDRMERVLRRIDHLRSQPEPLDYWIIEEGQVVEHGKMSSNNRDRMVLSYEDFRDQYLASFSNELHLLSIEDVIDRYSQQPKTTARFEMLSSKGWRGFVQTVWFWESDLEDNELLPSRSTLRITARYEFRPLEPLPSIEPEALRQALRSTKDGVDNAVIHCVLGESGYEVSAVVLEGEEEIRLAGIEDLFAALPDAATQLDEVAGRVSQRAKQILLAVEAIA